MKIKKRSPKKKDALKTGEIQSILQDILARVFQNVEKYRSAALASLSALIILGIAVGVYFYLSQKWDREASSLESRAYNHYIEGDYQGALSAYQDLVDNYSRSSSIPVALYYLGNSHLGLGQTDQAIHAYQRFIEKHRGNDTILPLVYMNLGYAYMGKKDYSNAISAFKEASTLKNSLIADRAVYETARAYEISGDMVSAVERYKYLARTYPSSPWSQAASSKLNKDQAVAPEARPQNKP